MSRVNQTNTTPLKFRENNMYTTEKMKPCYEFENELKKIQNKHDDEHKKLESKQDSELKELKQRYDNEREKLKNKQYQEIEKLFSNLLRRQNRHPSKKQGAKRIASRPSSYPTFSGSSEEQHPTTKQPSQHSSYNTCPSTPSGLSRKPTTELSNQYLSFHNPSEVNLNLEEWPNDGSYDCTVGIRDSSVFNEMCYSDNSPFSYFIPSNTYENPTLISKDGQENIRCQFSNIDMSDANDGSYSGRIGS
ncbi:14347_t:CDS:2 [Gigaspora margarita]|uniref:14347_t:CDS:1 n=1 Tax=Gigaspora margarita TaxID=4874 RepID=A0ABN7UCR0_GIGMA|nr:14347_t:CDS:2 [Gigaspora margarita]